MFGRTDNRPMATKTEFVAIDQVVSIRDALGAFLANRKNVRGRVDDTLKSYGERIGVWVSWLEQHGITRLDEVGPRHVEAFTAEYLAALGPHGDPHKASGVRQLLGQVRVFENWCLSMELTTRTPVKRYQLPDSDKEDLPPLKLAELDKILRAIWREGVGTRADEFSTRFETRARDTALVLTLADCGLRISEALQLRLGDLHLDDGYLILRAETTKGRKGKKRSRKCYLTAGTVGALRAYIPARGWPIERESRRDFAQGEPPEVPHNPGDAVFGAVATINSKSSAPLSYSGARELIARRCRQAGIPPARTHAFRRMFATALHKHVPWAVSEGLMGHSLGSTNKSASVYIDQEDEDDETPKEAHAKWSPVAQLARQPDPPPQLRMQGKPEAPPKARRVVEETPF